MSKCKKRVRLQDNAERFAEDGQNRTNPRSVPV
jgi:hypothetical protein